MTTGVLDDEALRQTLMAAATARRMVGYYQAQELQHLADYARATDDTFAVLEVSTLLCLSDRAAHARLRLARELTQRLPRTLESLRTGRIEEFKARLIADTVTVLSDEQASQVEDRVLAKAPGQTVGQLRAALAKAVLVVDPHGAEQRRLARRTQRRVTSQPTGDGEAVLSIAHSAARIAVIRAALRGRARQLRAEPDESRTLDQIEADLAADLLLGRAEGLQAVEVHLTMPAPHTHNDQAAEPAEFDGVGPITAPEAREWAAQAKSWRWVRTNPDTGQVEDVTYPSYRPPAALATFIKIRDKHCMFPGCTRSAWRSDLDHRVPWPDGPTTATNLNCLCRRHHRAKDHAGWRLHLPKPGWLRWISPLGHSRTIKHGEADPPPF
jgi:hypothetical protein